MKRILSFILALALMLGAIYIPGISLGLSFEKNSAVYASDDEIVVESTFYNLEDAIEARNDYPNSTKYTIKLSADATLSSNSLSRSATCFGKYTIKKDTIIDFNGHTITAELDVSSDADNKTRNVLEFYLSADGGQGHTLTFEDSVGGGGVTLNADTYIDMPLAAVSVESMDHYYVYGIYQTGAANLNKTVINGGTYRVTTNMTNFSNGSRGTNTSTDQFYRCALLLNSSSAEINGGTFEARCSEDCDIEEYATRDLAAVGTHNYGYYYEPIYNFTINGGEFLSDGYAFRKFSVNSIPSDLKGFKITAGHFEGGIDINGNTFYYLNDGDDELNGLLMSQVIDSKSIMYKDDVRTDSGSVTWEEMCKIDDLLVVSENDYKIISATPAMDGDKLVKNISLHLNDKLTFMFSAPELSQNLKDKGFSLTKNIAMYNSSYQQISQKDNVTSTTFTFNQAGNFIVILSTNLLKNNAAQAGSSLIYYITVDNPYITEIEVEAEYCGDKASDVYLEGRCITDCVTLNQVIFSFNGRTSETLSVGMNCAVVFYLQIDSDKLWGDSVNVTWNGKTADVCVQQEDSSIRAYGFTTTVEAPAEGFEITTAKIYATDITAGEAFPAFKNTDPDVSGSKSKVAATKMPFTYGDIFWYKDTAEIDTNSSAPAGGVTYTAIFTLTADENYRFTEDTVFSFSKGNVIFTALYGNGTTFKVAVQMVCPSDVVLGDLNSDGVVTSSDVLYLLKGISSSSAYSLNQGADFDLSTQINAADCILLLRFTLNSGEYHIYENDVKF